jgi:sugar phosphate isomerase/epimerase/nitrite reductase/ring-hydroxylating ferredoxin subunit
MTQAEIAHFDADDGIKIGFSTNVLFHPSNDVIAKADLVEAFGVLSGLFEAVEIELSEDIQKDVLDCPPERYQAIVTAVRHLAGRNGNRLSVHAPWYGEATNLAAPRVEERERSIALLSRAIDFAADVSAGFVTCHPGYHEGQEASRYNAHLRSALATAAAYARSRGVQLCLENMGADRPSYIVHSVEEMKEICAATGIRVTLDIIHLRSHYGSREAFFEALCEVAPLVANVHIADMQDARHAHVPIGDGNLPLEESLDVLGKAGYRGAAIIEEFVRTCDFQRFLDKAVIFRDRYGDGDAGWTPAAVPAAGRLATRALGAVTGATLSPAGDVVLESRDGRRVVRNVCPHTGVRLNAMAPLSVDGGYLVCSVHGALFNADGLCVRGPCKGRSLIPAPAQ